MIEKLDIKNGGVEDLLNCIKKINEVIDVVNALIKENNIHEEQIDELQMKLEPEKCETFVSIDEALKKAQKCEPADPYAEQRKWIGKVCKFWNWDTGLAHYSKLITIKDINDGEMSNCPFRADDGGWYMYCEPVKPDDDIIYKGGSNE